MPSSSIRIPELLTALCLLTASGCAGIDLPETAASTPATASGVEIPLDPYLGRLRTATVRIGERELPFLFDTAGGVTLLTVETADAIGCEPFGRDVGFRHDGEQVALQRCPNTDLRIGSHSVAAHEVTVWDLMALLPGAPEIGGLVSLETFEGEIVTLDLGGGRLRVESPESFQRRIADMVPLRVRDARQGGGSSLDLFVAVDTPKGPLWFELDSGALSPVLVAPHAADLLGLELSDEEPETVELPIHGLGPVEVEAKRKDDLIYDGLLNAAFLEEVVITMDLAEIRAWARRR